MRLRMRQQFLAGLGDFLVEDESGKLVYKINGRLFQIVARKFRISDPEGKELGLLTRRFWNWGLVFDLKCSDGRSASIRQHQFTAFRRRFSIHIRNGSDCAVTSDPHVHVFTFRMGEQDVARVSHKWFSISNAWELEIEECMDPMLVVASAIVFNVATH